MSNKEVKYFYFPTLKVIGGITFGDTVQSTFKFDHVEQHWIDGPNLIQARHAHAAGIVIDEDTNEKLVLVSGGKNSSMIFDSTEM